MPFERTCAMPTFPPVSSTQNDLHCEKGATMNRLQRIVIASVGAAVLAAPTAGAFAATPKKVVSITRKVTGPAAQASRWGYVQVALTVKKTTTTVGTKKTIVRKLVKISIP